jgi:hypothetical protein
MNDHIPDATKMISDTPRTDENEFDWVTASFARKLERQLNEANDRIKRLEEAGDVLAGKHLLAVNIYDNAKKHVAEWNKAKEAKL